MTFHDTRPWWPSIRLVRHPLVLMIAAFLSSCSNNDQLVAPATQAGVYGTVETPDHAPAAGALVLLESFVDPIAPVTTHDFFTSARTIPDGGFGIGPVPAAQYALLAGYSKASSTAGGAFDSLVSYSIVTISDPASYRIPERLTLRPPAIVAGRVITGTPLLKYVYVVGMGGQISGSTVDPAGEFAIQGVPQGTWRVMVYDVSGATPVLAVTVPGVVTRFGATTRVNDISLPSP